MDCVYPNGSNNVVQIKSYLLCHHNTKHICLVKATVYYCWALTYFIIQYINIELIAVMSQSDRYNVKKINEFNLKFWYCSFVNTIILVSSIRKDMHLQCIILHIVTLTVLVVARS